MLKFNVSNSDLNTIGNFSKKAVELKQQKGFSILNINIMSSREFCFFYKSS